MLVDIGEIWFTARITCFTICWAWCGTLLHPYFFTWRKCRLLIVSASVTARAAAALSGSPASVSTDCDVGAEFYEKKQNGICKITKMLLIMLLINIFNLEVVWNQLKNSAVLPKIIGRLRIVIHWTMCHSSWKHAISCMKMPAIRESPTYLITWFYLGVLALLNSCSISFQEFCVFSFIKVTLLSFFLAKFVLHVDPCRFQNRFDFSFGKSRPNSTIYPMVGVIVDQSFFQDNMYL